jgi:uncharacterized protein (DUF1778 family)
MYTKPISPTRPVNLRIQEDIRQLIDRAAHSLRKSRSDFMIDAARRAAEDTLLDQTFVRVDSETYNDFLTIFDTHPSSAAAQKLLNAPKPWAQ